MAALEGDPGRPRSLLLAPAAAQQRMRLYASCGPLADHTMSETRPRIISDFAEFTSLEGTWNRLLQESDGESSIYLTHEWLTTWWRHFGEGRQLNIVLIEDGARVIGAVPLMRTRYRLGFLRLDALETIGAVNCNRLGLVSGGHRREVAAALLRYLGRELATGRLSARFKLVPDDCKLLAEMRRIAPSLAEGLTLEERIGTVAPFIRLPSTWEQYWASLSGNARHQLSRRVRALERDHSVEYRVCSGDDLDERLDALIRLHQARWRAAGVSGVFSDPRMKSFYRDVARRFLERNWLHFSYLTVDGEMVAGEFSYIFNGTFYGVTSARDLRYAGSSVGHIHHMLFLKDAIARGLSECDMQKGDEPYKYRWARAARRYMDVMAVRQGKWLGARVALLRIFLRLRKVRRYGPREMCNIYRIRRRERRERAAMGLEQRYEGSAR